MQKEIKFDTIKFALDHLLPRAAELLGGPVRAFDAYYDCIYYLEQGELIPNEPLQLLNLERIYDGEPGFSLIYGLEIRTLRIPEGDISFVRTVDRESCGCASDLFAVLDRDYERLKSYLHEMCRKNRKSVRPPILSEELQHQLYRNTIGFLKRGVLACENWGIALKRGVLMMGEPGNGKTMAARWLMDQCRINGFEWCHVTSELYECYRKDGRASSLFSLDSPGIVFFDDVDKGMRDRAEFGTTSDHNTFLTGIDGVKVNHGVIYVFTSNASAEHLDPAFKRPGRIDVFLRFEKPVGSLRERLIREYWPDEMVQMLDVPAVVDQTEGMSFAEMDELKKLMVLEYLESETWNWDAAWSEYAQRASQMAPSN